MCTNLKTADYICSVENAQVYLLAQLKSLLPLPGSVGIAQTGRGFFLSIQYDKVTAIMPALPYEMGLRNASPLLTMPRQDVDCSEVLLNDTPVGNLTECISQNSYYTILIRRMFRSVIQVVSSWRGGATCFSDLLTYRFLSSEYSY